MLNQTIYADAQLAKCDVLDLLSDILLSVSYGIDCNLKEKEMQASQLQGLIWLAERDCLNENQICTVKKLLNKRILMNLCEGVEKESCDKYIACETIVVEQQTGDACDIKKPIIITVE